MDSTTTSSSYSGADITSNPNSMVSSGYTATTNTMSPGASITTNTMVSSAIHGGWPANPISYTPMPTMMNTSAAAPPMMYPSINRPMNLGQPYNMPIQPTAHYSNMVPYPF